MKTKLLAFIFLLLVFNSVTAQTVIKGSVLDAKSNEKLIGVSVLVKGATRGAQTDYDGQFTLKTEASLPLTLVVKYIGYEAKEISVTSTNTPIAVKLSKAENTLKEIKISDSRITEKIKQNPITVETMDAIAIKQTSAANFYEGLAHLKGVDLTSASIGFKIINTRGFNSTSPVRSLQLIDGVDNQSPGLNFSLGNFLGASELDIQKVDLVVGASSAYYGPNAFNGVINMQTKSPFLYPGLTAQVKAAERNLFEFGVRWAQVFKNKAGEDKWAYKLNLFYMRANDWNATNYAATDNSPAGTSNAGGYDAVNRYGDEYVNRIFYSPLDGLTKVGQGYYLRTGYTEQSLVDYNSRNLKLSGALHYKLKKDVELIYATSFGTGTTVYQGDNRFSLKDILFFQNKLEIKKDNKFFVRIYSTNEDAGNSYDVYSTAIRLQNLSKSDLDWGKDYNNSLFQNLSPKVLQWYSQNIGQGLFLDTIPGNRRLSFIENYWQTNFSDSLFKYHQMARERSDNLPSSNGTGVARFEPGTARFDSAFNSIISRTNREGGSRFFDQSALYHIAGGYEFSLIGLDFKSGANYRLYTPFSKGTIFLDTAANQRIYNSEAGAYLGIEKKFQSENIKFSNEERLLNAQVGLTVGALAGVLFSGIAKQTGVITNPFDLLFTVAAMPVAASLLGYAYDNGATVKLSFTNRVDKNQNFDYLWSPAATFLFTKKQHVLRFSASSAVRNPTLTDQYINLNVGRATLLGNLNGFQNLVTTESLIDFLNTQDRKKLLYFNVDAIKPEKVKTIEFGYRTTINKKIFIDASYYYSWYEDFLGYKIGTQVDIDTNFNLINTIKTYRVTTNSKQVVTTNGFTIGVNYFYKNYLGFVTNYSFNKLDKGNRNDGIIPAFNTPEHKYNIGVNGRDIEYINKKEKWGYSVNYKWQEGFLFEGSPQFTGTVPAYGMVDAQWNSTITKWHAVVKVGASNLLNNEVYQVYGGPYVGRLAYISFTFELNNWK